MSNYVCIKMYITEIYSQVYNTSIRLNWKGLHVCATSPTKFTTSYILVERSTSGNLSCSKNATDDTVGNTLRIPSEANMNCSENMAYGIITNTYKKNSAENISTSHTAVYVEVLPSNN